MTTKKANNFTPINNVKHMKNLLVFIFSLIVCQIFFACNNKQNANSSAESKNIFTTLRPFDKSNQEIKFGDVKYVSLETKDESLLGTVFRIKIYKGDFYMLDWSNFSIFRFDKNGKYISKIGQKGRAPGEYNLPTDFLIKDKKLEILDDCGSFSQIHKYNLNGEYEESKKLSKQLNCFQVIKEKESLLYVGYNGRDYDNKLIFLDNYGNEVKEVFKIQKENILDAIFLVNNLHKINDNTMLLYEPFSPDIFRITGTSINQQYKLDFEKYALPGGLNKFEEIRKHGYCTVKECLENDTYVFFYLGTEENRERSFYYLLYNKENNRTYSLKMGKRHIPVSLTKDNYLIILKHADALSSESKINNHLREKVPELFEKTKESDNPIIVFLKLQCN